MRSQAFVSTEHAAYELRAGTIHKRCDLSVGPCQWKPALCTRMYAPSLCSSTVARVATVGPSSLSPTLRPKPYHYSYSSPSPSLALLALRTRMYAPSSCSSTVATTRSRSDRTDVGDSSAEGAYVTRTFSPPRINPASHTSKYGNDHQNFLKIGVSV